MNRARRGLRLSANGALLSMALLACTAHAETHGLILGIAEYPAPSSLPYVKKDVELAKKLAHWANVPVRNLLIVQDAKLGLEGFRETLRHFSDGIKEGDEVFLYYSGHGGRSEVQNGVGKPQCAESFISYDLKTYMDQEFQTWLQQISLKASKVMVFADSCHSGGVAEEKSSRAMRNEHLLIKAHPRFVARGSEHCEAVNLAKMSIATRSLRSNAVYMAAARDDEAAWASPYGSIATLAWVKCLAQSGISGSRSGAVTAEDLRSCAQSWIDVHGYNQHLHVVGNDQIVLGFDKDNAIPRVETATSPPVLPGVFDSLVQNADPKRTVSIRPTQDQVVVGRDQVELDVATSEPGYLYLLYLGSDGKTLDLLYPNTFEENNYIAAGTHRFPNRHWQIDAGGPAGVDSVLAIVSPMKRNFSALGSGSTGPFPVLLNNASSPKETRSFMRETLQPDNVAADDCHGRSLAGDQNSRDCVQAYGAAVARIREIEWSGHNRSRE